MDTYVKLAAGIMITMILCLLLPKQKMELSVLLCIAVCAMVLVSVASYLEPVISLFKRLIELGNLPGEFLEILFKVVGIGVISQIISVFCIDAGNQSLAKTLQIATSAVVLWLCVPLIEQLLAMIETILGVT